MQNVFECSKNFKSDEKRFESFIKLANIPNKQMDYWKVIYIIIIQK